MEPTAVQSITASVEKKSTVEESVATLVQGVAATISSAASNPTLLSQIAAELHTSAAAIGAAVVANTADEPKH